MSAGDQQFLHAEARYYEVGQSVLDATKLRDATPAEIIELAKARLGAMIGRARDLDAAKIEAAAWASKMRAGHVDQNARHAETLEDRASSQSTRGVAVKAKLSRSELIALHANALDRASEQRRAIMRLAPGEGRALAKQSARYFIGAARNAREVLARREATEGMVHYEYP